MALIALVVGGVGIVLADASAPGVTQETEDGVWESLCQGLGPMGIRDGWGFWSALSEEQRDELVSAIESLIEEGTTHEEIRDTIAGKLQKWGTEPPLFSGPYYGENGGRDMCIGGHGFRSQRRAGCPTTTG